MKTQIEPIRCAWCDTSDIYRHYHDTEWGVPVLDDQRIFEKICLEGFQSGLSWLTILRKRDSFRSAFSQFDIAALAQYTDADVTRLLANAGIVRHKGKIQAVINNAKAALRLLDTQPSLAAYIWQFEPAQQPQDALMVRAQCPESVALSKDLKKRGWAFVGPTTMYAFMQSIGMVNDHGLDCHSRALIDQQRQQFARPR